LGCAFRAGGLKAREDVETNVEEERGGGGGETDTPARKPLLPVLLREVSGFNDGAPMDVPMRGEEGRLWVVD
jgi:hypothetical protein